MVTVVVSFIVKPLQLNHFLAFHSVELVFTLVFVREIPFADIVLSSATKTNRTGHTGTKIIGVNQKKEWSKD